MADERALLTDLKITLRRNELRPVYVVDSERSRVPNSATVVNDLQTTSGRENLGQAVILRLLTERGELTALGHPEYGSRIYELLGQPNTETSRNLLKLFILESLQAEPRIKTVIEARITPATALRNVPETFKVNVLLRVQPISDLAIVTIGPFILEL
jgi:phage baseplate assembly protein W